MEEIDLQIAGPTLLDSHSMHVGISLGRLPGYLTILKVTVNCEFMLLLFVSH